MQETQAAYGNGGLLSMWSRPALVHAASSALPAAQPLLTGGGGAANWAAVDAARRPSQPNGKVRAARASLGCTSAAESAGGLHRADSMVICNRDPACSSALHV